MGELVWSEALQFHIQVVNGRTVDIKSQKFVNAKENTIRYDGKDVITGIELPDFNLNIGNTFYLKGLPYKVWGITAQTKSCYRLTFSKLSKASYFVFPMLGLDIDEFLWSLYFMNVYTNVEGHDEEGIFLHYRYSDNQRFKDFESKVEFLSGYRSHLDIDKYHVLYQFDIPEKYKREFELFKKGKYSHFSEEYKQTVLQFHKTTEMARQRGTTIENTQLHGILYKSPLLKENIEKKIGQNLLTTEEVYSIPNAEEETFFDKYKILSPLQNGEQQGTNLPQ